MLLQQTTAQAVTPYYRAFVEKWPEVEDLAAAPIEAVISAFAGPRLLFRARNLHACAKAVAARGGRFPCDEAAFRLLPGVGAYTAAAIAAIAFDLPAAPVDGNIARILARLTALEAPIAESRKTLAAAARALAPPAGRRLRPGADGYRRDDLPAPQPRLRRVSAESRLRGVPLRRAGDLSAEGQTEDQSRGARARSSSRTGRDGAFLARRRPPKGLLASTVELPGTPWTSEGPGASWSDGAPLATRWLRLPGAGRAGLHPFRAEFLVVYVGAYEGGAPDSHFWVEREAVGEAGFSNVMRKAVAACD